MNFAFTDEQEELRATARAFLADNASSEAARSAMESELGWDPDLWKRIASEMGWTALPIPEAYSGLGLGPVELVALLEVMGEALLCSPYLSSVCLGAGAILAAGSEEQKRELLPSIAAGDTRAALAVTESGPYQGPDGVTTEARRDGGDWVLSGAKRFVVDGHTADLLVVAARDEEGGLGLFAVPGESASVKRHGLATMDRTRRLADVDLRHVRVPGSARLGGAGDATPALARALDVAAVTLASEQVGGAQRCLDLSVAHAKERVQFGRPIGSFQAIQHTCADMMVALESARSGVYYAACAAQEESDELAVAASLAKATASEAFFRCAADALQVHGGVGFTWEYDIHLYLKRARASEGLLGTPDWHRERVARHLGLGVEP